MSTATVQTSSRRNGKAIHDGRQIDLTESSPVEMTRESIVSETIANDKPEPAKVRTLAELNADYETSLDFVASAIGRLLSGTKLAVYCDVGRACLEHLQLAKLVYDEQASAANVASEWNSDRYDDECGKMSQRVRVHFPELTVAQSKANDEREANGRKKRDPIQVTEYVHCHLTVEALRPIVGDCIGELSYFLVRNYVMRKMTALSKSKLHLKVKDGWREFARTEIPRVASGNISVGQFIAQMDAHADKLKDSADKTDETSAKVAESVKLASKIKDALTDSLSKAMSGILKDEDICTIIETIVKESGRSLPILAQSKPIDPASISADEILTTLRSMFVLQRHNEVAAICAACATMVQLIPTLAPTMPKLAEAV